MLEAPKAVPPSVPVPVLANQDSGISADAKTAIGFLYSGQADLALASFDKLLQQSPPSGFGLVIDDQDPAKDEKALIEITHGTGKASLLNNKGCALLLLGEYEKALLTFDAAVIEDGNLTSPWVNGALAALRLGKIGLAEGSLAAAKALGADSARTLTLKAEAALARGQTLQAEELLDKAESESPNFLPLYWVRSKAFRDSGQSAKAERDLATALSQGPLLGVMTGSKKFNGDWSVLGGGTRNTHIKGVVHAAGSKGLQFQFNLVSDRMDVENREEAYQWRDDAGLIYQSQSQTLGANYRLSGGGRPGALQAAAGVNPDPSAKFRLEYFSGFWLGSQGGLRWQARYSSSRLFGSGQGRPRELEVKDETLLLEAGLKEGPWSFGAAYQNLERGGRGLPAFDPAETIMPAGTSRTWTVYGLRSLDLSQGFSAQVGIALDHDGAKPRILPMAALTFGSNNPISIGVSSRTSTPLSFAPGSSRPRTPLKNLIDRHSNQPQDFNLDPALNQRETRVTNIEASIPLEDRVDRTQTLTVFHRLFSSLQIQGADPRAASTQQVSPFDKGEATGLEWQGSADFTKGISAKLTATYQWTKGSPGTPVFSAADFPARNPSSLSSLANFPRFQAHAELTWARGPSAITVAGSYMGPRPRALTVRDQTGALITWVGEADEAFGLHLFAQYSPSPGLKLQAGLFNLARARFYTGYPASTTGFFGVNYRF